MRSIQRLSRSCLLAACVLDRQHARAPQIEGLEDAAADAQSLDIEDVAIPVASKATLLRTKQTMRPTDIADRQFLQSLVDAEGSSS